MTNDHIVKLSTQRDIETELEQLGLEKGQIVEVHSSLSSIGYVDGGAPKIVNALMNVVGEEGSIVMSLYPVSKPIPLSGEEKAWGIRAKVQTYGEDYHGPTGMGVIADEFFRRHGTILGPKWHRVCAWGRYAEQLSKGYHVLLEMDGWVLLLGVDIRRCSSMHQAEKYLLPQAIVRYFDPPEDIRRKYPTDIYLSYGQTFEDAWLKIQTEAERQGIIKIGQIGNATSRFFKARSVVGMYEEALRIDPWGFFDVRNNEANH
jgi:aminoglycoside N3'-acetyltransferase